MQVLINVPDYVYILQSPKRFTNRINNRQHDNVFFQTYLIIAERESSGGSSKSAKQSNHKQVKNDWFQC